MTNTIVTETFETKRGLYLFQSQLGKRTESTETQIIMNKVYKEALEKANSQLFGLTLTELGDESFTIEGEYFTLDFQPVLEHIQIHAHEKTDIVVECLMYELDEMTCILESLQPYMDKLYNTLISNKA